MLTLGYLLLGFLFGFIAGAATILYFDEATDEPEDA